MIRNSSALALPAAALVLLGGCSKPSDDGSSAAANTTEAPSEAAAPEPVAFASLTGNAAAGEAAFAQCKACHSLEEGQSTLGPTLHKVIGRPAGAIAGFSYSPALKSSGIVWSEEKIFAYLEKPQALVPGTRMSFAGFPDPQKRADVIAWIKANGGS